MLIGTVSSDRTARPRSALAGAVAAALFAPALASAVEFQAASGELTGSWDTTLSYGQSWRAKGANLAGIGSANGGTGSSPNFDDGDLNYHSGDAFSKALKVTSEISLKYHNYGAFVRGSGLYDFAVMDGNTRRTPISSEAKVVAGSYVRLLDAFAYGKWKFGDHPFELRVGKQVLNWGESTFIASPFTEANAFDLAALHVPGAELKEAFLPQGMVRATFGITPALSAEAYYQFQWYRTELDPTGTYFSTNDFAGRGGRQVFLGFGALSDQGTDFSSLGGGQIADYQAIGRDRTRDPKNGGQYGVNLRWFADNLGAGTDLSLHFVNYHSHAPIISARAGTAAGVANAVGAATAVAGAAQGLASGLPPAGAIGAAAQFAVATAAARGGNLSLAQATQYATIGANTALHGGNTTAIQNQASNAGINEYAQTAGYYTEYPEDIRALGASFNTQIGRTGIALQGELSYSFNVPLQYDDTEILAAANTPLEAALLAANHVPAPGSCVAALPTATRCGQLGSYGLNADVQGYARYSQWQYQMTATKAWPRVLGAQQLIMVGEVGVTYMPGLPDKASGGLNGQGLVLEAPGTFLSPNPLLNQALSFGHLPSGNVADPYDRFPTKTSWGYRLLARAEYDNVFRGWNVTPRVFWSQDVSGTAPGPGGNFIEGRYALTAGVNASLRNTYELDVSYSHFGGGGVYNPLNDRDFVAASIKYSF
jgi:Protein of unknown function (DUF1302)